MARMTLACVGAADLPRPVQSFVAERAEGIPFLVEEVLAGLIAEGALAERDGTWQAGDRAEQRPVETAAQHRGRAQDVPGIGVHRVKPPPHRVRERGRDGRRHQVGGVPAAVPLGQRPLPDQARQYLLVQERDALGLLRDE